LDSDNEANPAPEVVVIAGTAALVATAGTCFILENEAKADNVARALGAAAKSVFESSILAGAAIAFGRGPELHGCTLAQSAVIFAQTGGMLKPETVLVKLLKKMLQLTSKQAQLAPPNALIFLVIPCQELTLSCVRLFMLRV
jgi:hypothetical protein